MPGKTRNLTLAVSEEIYYNARLFAAERGMSLSQAVGFLLENLPAVTRAVRQMLEENPDFGSGRPPSKKQKACETVKSLYST